MYFLIYLVNKNEVDMLNSRVTSLIGTIYRQMTLLASTSIVYMTYYHHLPYDLVSYFNDKINYFFSST